MSDETVREALLEHWRDVYPPEETMILPRFLVVAEVIDRDGEEGLRIMHSEGLAPWTMAGMLRGASLITDKQLDEGWEGDDDD